MSTPSQEQPDSGKQSYAELYSDPYVEVLSSPIFRGSLGTFELRSDQCHTIIENSKSIIEELNTYLGNPRVHHGLLRARDELYMDLYTAERHLDILASDSLIPDPLPELIDRANLKESGIPRELTVKVMQGTETPEERKLFVRLASNIPLDTSVQRKRRMKREDREASKLPDHIWVADPHSYFHEVPINARMGIEQCYEFNSDKMLFTCRKNRGMFALNVFDQILTLSGKVFETGRWHYRGRSDVSSPLVFPSMYRENTGLQFPSYESHCSFRIPFGQSPFVKETLLGYQRDFGLKHLKATVELSGRIDPEFLSWIFEGTIENPGYIPDVEIVYALPLPSGANYRFVLKAARTFSQKPSNLGEHFSYEDSLIIEGLNRYISDTYERGNWDLFTDLDIPEASDQLIAEIAGTGDVLSLNSYVDLKRCWLQSTWAVLHAIQSRRISLGNFTQPHLQEGESLEQAVCKALERIPRIYRFGTPGYFELRSEEIPDFLETYLPEIERVVEAEALRLEDADYHTSAFQRTRLGYKGPPEGYKLSLDYIVMDMITDMRRKADFKLKRSRRDHVSLDEVHVPETVGRSYRRDHRTFGTNELKKRVSSLDPTRTVIFFLHDPIELNPESQVESSDPLKTYGEILDSNIERIKWRLTEYFQTKRKEVQDHMKERIALLTFARSCRALRNQIRIVEAAYEKLKKKHGQDLATLNLLLKEEDVSRDEIRIRMSERREKFVEEEEGMLLHEVYKAKDEYISFLRTSLQGVIAKACIMTNAIVDQEISKWIYSIGSDGLPRFAEEEIRNNKVSRPSHSEQLQGLNMYGGGELILGRHHESFQSIQSWHAFYEKLKKARGKRKIKVLELNNFSGHYQPSADATLNYSWAIMKSYLQRAGLGTKETRLVDRLAPGLTPGHRSLYVF